MKLLAINTAFKEANIGFFDGENKFYKTIESNSKHAEIILKNIDNILGNNKIRDIDIISVVVGPGSFTGVRIATALAKGFMVADNKLKGIAINSLDLMSYIYQKNNVENDYYCVLNALSGNYFVAKYSKTGECIVSPKMVNGEELEKVAKDYVVGLHCEDIEFADYYIEFTSEALLEFSLNKYENNELCEEANLNPVYLRLSQAEQNLKDKEDNDKRI